MSLAVLAQEMIPVAIYARVSSEEQAKGESISHQVEMLRNEVRKLGENYYNDNSLVYIDEAISGYYVFFLDRPDIKRMLDDGKAGRYKVALFKDISRMSRDSDDTNKLFNAFESLGIRVKQINSGIDTAHESSKIMASFMSKQSEDFSVFISKNVSSGMREKARKGQWSSSTPPLGYRIDKETKKLALGGEDAVESIRIAFNLYTEDLYGTTLIAKHLNDAGYRTATGKPFTKKAIMHILRNTAYQGDVHYGKTRNVKQNIYDEQWSKIGVKKVSLKTDDSVYVPDAHPAIVSREQFARTQELISEKTMNTDRKCYAKYPLVGIVKCPECGAGLVSAFSTQGGGKYRYRYYVCSTWYRVGGKHGCPNKQLINSKKLEKAVLDSVIEELSKVDKEASHTVSDKNDSSVVKARINKINKEKEKLAKMQSRTLSNADLMTDDVFRSTMLELKEKIIHCDKQLATCEEQLKSIESETTKTLTREELLKSVAELEKDDIDGMRKLFHQTIESIIVLDKKTIGEVVFKYHF